MLIELDESLRHIDWDDPEVVRSIENIFTLVFEGYHAVIAPRSLLDFVIGSNDVGSPTRAAALQVKSHAFEASGLYNLVSVKVTVDLDCRAPYRVSTTQWRIPVEFFRGSTNKLALLCEDITDSKLYAFAGRHYRASKRYKGVDVFVRHYHGGGQSTHQVFEQLLQDGEICLCIVDSDKKCPDGSLGDIARQCHRTSQNALTPHGYVYTTNRALENEIPNELIEEVLSEDSVPNWDKILAFGVVEHAKLKGGCMLRSFLGFREDSPERAYWEPVINELAEQGSINEYCIQNKECPKGGGCDCQVTPPIDERIAERVLDFLENRSIHKTWELIDPSTNEAWLRIGRSVFEWGVAFKPVRS